MRQEARATVPSERSGHLQRRMKLGMTIHPPACAPGRPACASNAGGHRGTGAHERLRITAPADTRVWRWDIRSSEFAHTQGPTTCNSHVKNAELREHGEDADPSDNTPPAVCLESVMFFCACWPRVPGGTISRPVDLRLQHAYKREAPVGAVVVGRTRRRSIFDGKAVVVQVLPISRRLGL